MSDNAPTSNPPPLDESSRKRQRRSVAGASTGPDVELEAKPPESPPKPASARLYELCQGNAPGHEVQKVFLDVIRDTITASGLESKYNFLFLHGDGSLLRFHADQIYSAVSMFKERKPILLTLQSWGGDIAAGYLISRLCREYSGGQFAVAVPRAAKSAATLLCCGAEQIHMGSMSDLGPIDPQMDGLPALALKNSLEHLLEIVMANPSASDMIATFLSKTLNIPQIGYFERVAESAIQYAERLLTSRTTKSTGLKAAEVAKRLVYHYKDHGFVIDSSEATEIFGREMIQLNTPEYNLANQFHQQMALARFFIGNWKGDAIITGSLDSGIMVYKKPQAN